MIVWNLFLELALSPSLYFLVLDLQTTPDLIKLDNSQYENRWSCILLSGKVLGFCVIF